MTAHAKPPTNDLEAFWMPFTPNRAFKADPRLVERAEGMYYYTPDHRAILDATSGLWCVNAGHCRPQIVEAIQRQAARMGYATSFNLGHPKAFELASRLAHLLPGDLDHVFFTNSGSESVDTALKIALAYHKARGKGSKTRFIGRERGYHGVGFGGISVGGIVGNRKQYGALLPGVDHLPHTHDPARNAFSKGLPEHGGEDFAGALEGIVGLHDASTIAAVIVEPVAGSTGVLVPPKGYLERLRAICDRHDILLIFDEVITGFGRLGAPFAAEYFGVQPDMITMAKGLTNAAVPMGAVGVRGGIYETLVNGGPGIELAHGYTYSGHPLACAAGLATLDLYRDEGLFERAAALASGFEAVVHSLRDAPHVIDIRNLGLMAGVELAPRPGAPGARAQEAFQRAFEEGLLIRVTGDTIAFSPSLITDPAQIEEMVAVTRAVLETID